MELTTIEEIWKATRREAEELIKHEPRMKASVVDHILSQDDLADAIANVLARRLGDAFLPSAMLREVAGDAYQDTAILAATVRDIQAVVARNVACPSLLMPLLFLKGNIALTAYRVAHMLWHREERNLALAIQAQTANTLAIDIHPAARIGSSIFLDHGSGVVVGETSIVEDDVGIWHNVCLGSTFKHAGDRHPKIRRGAVLGTGATILGNIEIGESSVIAAGSVVLASVPPHTTAAGAPARIVSNRTNISLVSDSQANDD